MDCYGLVGFLSSCAMHTPKESCFWIYICAYVIYLIYGVGNHGSNNSNPAHPTHICQNKTKIWVMCQRMNEIDRHQNENQQFRCCCCWWRIKCRLISFYLRLFCVLSLDFMWAFIDCLLLLISWIFYSLNKLPPDAQVYQQCIRLYIYKHIYFT